MVDTVATGSGSTVPDLLCPDSRKRKNSSSEDSTLTKRRMSWYYVLGSESEIESEGSESIYSVQQKSTDCAKDTSDTSSKSSREFDIQFEVDSLSEDGQIHPFPNDDNSSSGPEEAPRPPQLIIEDISDVTSISTSLSSSISDSSDKVDPELSLADFWTCAQCREKNNNPLFRYCEKCFKVRKNFFPPRPQHKKPRKPRKRRNRKNSTVSNENESTSNKPQLTQVPISSNVDIDKEDPDSNRSSDLCGTCFLQPKDGGYAHGNNVHVYSCYKCSVKIFKQRGRCPICNRKVRQILKIIMY